MSFLMPSTSIDLNDPKYAHIHAQNWLVQNVAGEYECVERPEDGILCRPGCMPPKFREIDRQPCPVEKPVDICGCGGCGSSGGAGEDGVSAEEQAAITAGIMANNEECIAAIAAKVAEKAAA